MDKDKYSKLVSDSIGLLVTKHPLRTSIGVLLGIVISTVNNIVTNLYGSVNPLHNISDVKFIFLGIFITHLPILISLFKSKPEFDENIETAFKAIEKAKINGMPKCQINTAYRNLCKIILENTELKK